MRELNVHFAAMATKLQRAHLKHCDWREPKAPARCRRKSKHVNAQY